MPETLQPILPNARVLSYIASADSPTRVRKIAARALGVLGALHAIAGLAAVTMFLWDLHKSFEEYQEFAKDPAAVRWLPPLHDWLWDAGVDDGRWMFLFINGVTIAAVLFACARPVGRGKNFACYVAIAGLIVPMLQLLLVSAACGGAAILEGLGIGGHPERMELWFIVPTVVLVMLFLLLWDLAGYLRWIARNPITEISPKSFLPVRSGIARDNHT